MAIVATKYDKHYPSLRMIPFLMILSDLDFKVTPLFNAEYLRNGMRFKHITNRDSDLRSSQKCHFE